MGKPVTKTNCSKLFKTDDYLGRGRAYKINKPVMLSLPWKMAKKVKHIRDLSEGERRAFKQKYDVFFFDMDGTLEVANSSPIPGVSETVEELHSSGKILHVLTDSCVYSKDAICQKLSRNFPFIKKENIMTTSLLVVDYLKKIKLNNKVYVIGEENGLVKDLSDAGFHVLYDDEPKKYTLKDLFSVGYEEDVGAVIVGLDVNFNYMKLMKAINYLLNPSTLFLQTHGSVTAFIKPIFPVAGAYSLPMITITKREPQLFSKGTPTSVQYVQSLGYSMEKCMFVGDLPETDICCGNRCGMDTLLVLSGDTTSDILKELIEKGDDEQLPTYVADSIADLQAVYTD